MEESATGQEQAYGTCDMFRRVSSPSNRGLRLAVPRFSALSHLSAGGVAPGTGATEVGMMRYHAAGLATKA